MKAKIIQGKKENLTKKIVQEIVNVLKENPNAILCLPTGNSPLTVYEQLVEKFVNNEISFKNVKTFNLDEYLEIDPNTNPISFRNFMKDNLFSKVDIDPNNYHFPTTPEEYNKELDSFDKFDLTLLGVGVNGHIAFNEPGTSLDKRTNIVKLTKSTIDANFPGMKDYPKTAITMGLHDISHKSKEIIIMAWGETKRDALNQFIKGKKNNQCPITLLSNLPNVTIYTDIENLKIPFKFKIKQLFKGKK